MQNDLLPIIAMERAVDIVLSSPHPTSKVAAAIFGRDLKGDDYIIARTNHWPEKIENTLGRDARIGQASGTIHAETACILNAPYTKGASICVTDPFCPNCAKNIVEAGIKAVYIDHKGFIKDFAARRGSEFENMSLKLVERAGIAIFEVIRKDKIIQPIQLPPEGYRPKIENPADIEVISGPASQALFLDEIKSAKSTYKDQIFCLAFSKDMFGKLYRIILKPHRSRGIYGGEQPAPAYALEQKYTYTISPLNRLMVGAHKHGHHILPDFVYCSHIPSSRELVNLMGENATFTLSLENSAPNANYSSEEGLLECEKVGLIKINRL